MNNSDLLIQYLMTQVGNYMLVDMSQLWDSFEKR